jgi:transcription initiation factor TFIIIB Brf1 subunit/transcription initiation factor TFIIB
VGEETRQGGASQTSDLDRHGRYAGARRRLARLHRNTLHSRERRLVEIGAELKRVRECAGLPQSVVEEAESLVKRYFEVVRGFPPEVVAVAVLWTAAKATGLEDKAVPPRTASV